MSWPVAVGRSPRAVIAEGDDPAAASRNVLRADVDVDSNGTRFSWSCVVLVITDSVGRLRPTSDLIKSRG
jgi:hypothetical protein